jgi:methionyl aminopeptidase
MKQPCRIVAEILSRVAESVIPGVTTMELDLMAEKLARSHKATPAFKGYSGYPFSLCCSVNNQVVHGMPSERVLLEGDIISLDFGVVHSGFYGDAAVTVPVGSVTDDARKLMEVTEDSLYRAIKEAVPGKRLSDISYAVQSFVEDHGFFCC